jgi:coronin-7
MTMKIWNLESLEQKQCLRGHTDQIFSFAWSSCGTFGATVCKDGKVRIYDVRKSDSPIREGIGGPVGTRGARITYVLEDLYLVVTGFDKVSERQVYIFKVENLDQAIGMVGLDVSPAILVPFYDEDSSTLFATGRGKMKSSRGCLELNSNLNLL